MRSLDMHAHLMPQRMLHTLYRGETWYGVSGEWDAQGRLAFGLGSRNQTLTPAFSWNTEQRLANMDSLGVDNYVVSTFVGYYLFESDDQASAAYREANEEVAQMAKDHPDRFGGFATLPVQNIKAAIYELE